MLGGVTLIVIPDQNGILRMLDVAVHLINDCITFR